jgi:hypothetical protein
MRVNVTEVNEEVLFALDASVTIDRAFIERLKAKALGNNRRRVRRCAHRTVDDEMHKMLIVHTKSSYITARKHPAKSEIVLEAIQLPRPVSNQPAGSESTVPK